MPKRTRAIDLWDAPVYSNIKDDDTNELEDNSLTPAPGQARVESATSNLPSEDDDEDESSNEASPDDDSDLNPTCVTPFIALLASKFYQGLDVAGSQQNIRSADSITKEMLMQSDEYNNYMRFMLQCVHAGVSRIIFEEPYVVEHRSQWYNAVRINSVLINVCHIHCCLIAL